MEINKLARNLAVEMQGTTPGRDKLEKEFNQLWCSWIEHLDLKDEIEFMSIADQIEELLYDTFSADAAFFKDEGFNADQSYDHLEKLEGSISKHRIIPTDHFSRHYRWMLHEKEKSDTCRNQIVNIINKTFRNIYLMLSELNSQDIKFEISYVKKIMIMIVYDIDQHNDHIMNHYSFNLLPPFRAMILNHVVIHVSNIFSKMNEKYNKKHSPKSQIEMYKKAALAMFINLVEQRREDVIAAGF